MQRIRNAPFALRVVQRKDGKAGIVYQRRSDDKGRDRLQRVAALSPLAFTAATPFLRDAISKSQFPGSSSKTAVRESKIVELTTGPYHPLDSDWGARVACSGIISAGLRDGERLLRAVSHIRNADPNEAAWWLGMLTQDDSIRAIRALRILTEAVK